MEKVIVQFTAKSPPYNAGEIAGFDLMAAKKLIDANVAELYVAPPPSAEDDESLADKFRGAQFSPPLTVMEIDPLTVPKVAPGQDVVVDPNAPPSSVGASGRTFESVPAMKGAKRGESDSPGTSSGSGGTTEESTDKEPKTGISERRAT